MRLLRRITQERRQEEKETIVESSTNLQQILTDILKHTDSIESNNEEIRKLTATIEKMERHIESLNTSSTDKKDSLITFQDLF